MKFCVARAHNLGVCHERYQILPTGSILTEVFPVNGRQKSQGYAHIFPFEVKRKLSLLIKTFISPNNKNHGFESTTVPIKWKD